MVSEERILFQPKILKFLQKYTLIPALLMVRVIKYLLRTILYQILLHLEYIYVYINYICMHIFKVIVLLVCKFRSKESFAIQNLAQTNKYWLCIRNRYVYVERQEPWNNIWKADFLVHQSLSHSTFDNLNKYK